MPEVDIISFLLGFFAALLSSIIYAFIQHRLRLVEARYKILLDLEQEALIEERGSASTVHKEKTTIEHERRVKRWLLAISIILIILTNAGLVAYYYHIRNSSQSNNQLVLLFALSPILFSSWCFVLFIYLFLRQRLLKDNFLLVILRDKLKWL